MSNSGRTLTRGKARLAAVVQMARDVVRIEDAQQALDLTRTQAAKLLSRWAAQGWLRRVGTGTYVSVPLDLLDSEQVLEDPWILVPALFAPAYIGGRTAAEHWDLTEQIFRDILVYTARSIRVKTVETQSAVFILKNIREELIFGTKTVWRGQTRVAVSDLHRTIIDMLEEPAVGGGVQHVADCFTQYLSRPERDPQTLVDYAERLGNGVVFKRLGFLAERDPRGTSLAAACKKHLTKGNAMLDPALDCTRLVTRWRLWIPETWAEDRSHDR